MKSWGRSDPVSMLLGKQDSLACHEDAAQCRSSYKTMINFKISPVLVSGGDERGLRVGYFGFFAFLFIL